MIFCVVPDIKTKISGLKTKRDSFSIRNNCIELS